MAIAHGSTTLPTCALALAGTGTPFVYRNIGDPAHWAGSVARRVRTRVLLGRARAVVALTSRSAEELAARYRVPRDRIHVIPRGVPASRFPPVNPAMRSDARRRFGLEGDGPLALYLGSLTSEKNVGLAIEAVASLPSLQLLIAGDGSERAALEAEASRLAPGRVRFAGTVTDPHQALAAADVVVLPSRTEGLPGALIEAGLAGLPVVATDVGFVREIVVDGETGRLVPVGDPPAFAQAITGALREAETLGRAARARCLARYELEVVADTWDALLATITGRGAETRSDPASPWPRRPSSRS